MLLVGVLEVGDNDTAYDVHENEGTDDDEHEEINRRLRR